MKTDPFTVLRHTAKLAKKRGLKGFTITMQQVGDAFHIYGAKLTPAKLLRHITKTP